MFDIQKIELLLKEIISLSEDRLSQKASSKVNTFVIEGILREFKEILQFLQMNGKLRLCAKRLPISTRWTIIDSAEYECKEDNILFDKVRYFNDTVCKEVEESYKVYTDLRE